MTTQELAKEIYRTASLYTHGYMGSSMLSNYEYPDAKIANTKGVGMLIIDQVILELNKVKLEYNLDSLSAIDYWNDIKTELEILQIDQQ